MRGLSKVLVLIAVVSAVGYSFHRFESCQIVGAPPGALTSGAMPVQASGVQLKSTSSTVDDILVYPGPRALKSLNLGYEIVRLNSDGSTMALPLPPGKALQTTFMLFPAGHHSLSVRAMDDRCAAEIDVRLYKVDQASPVFAGQISPAAKAAPLVIDLGKEKLHDPFVATVKLSSGAKNNWFCNVAFSWRNTK